MGLVHLENPNGEKNIVCGGCGTPIANKDWLMDANRDEKTFLFTKAKNLKYG